MTTLNLHSVQEQLFLASNNHNAIAATFLLMVRVLTASFAQHDGFLSLGNFVLFWP
jgi:hypothetical protein